MSKIKMSLSLFLLISMKISASDMPWGKTDLSQTARLEQGYVRAADKLFVHDKMSTIVDAYFNESIIKDTNQKYTKQDGTLSEITTEDILQAIIKTKTMKKSVALELVASDCTKQVITKRALKRLESKRATRDEINRFMEKSINDSYRYGVLTALSNRNIKTNPDWKSIFTPIAQEAARKAVTPKSVGVIAWLLGKSKK